MGLRNLFGPSRREIWRQLSEEAGGKIVEGRWGNADKVQVQHGEWTMTLDTYVVHAGKTIIVFTRMRAPFVNPEGFRFTIYRKGIFSGIGKMLGMQDIEVGSAEFDDAFVIKGTDESRVRQLFGNETIRTLLAAQKDVHLSVKDDEGWFGPKFPDGVDELSFAVPGVIKDVERLKSLYELFAATLDELCRMGSAYKTDPEVTL
jgi:hypothetical protein